MDWFGQKVVYCPKCQDNGFIQASYEEIDGYAPYEFYKRCDCYEKWRQRRIDKAKGEKK